MGDIWQYQGEPKARRGESWNASRNFADDLLVGMRLIQVGRCRIEGLMIDTSDKQI